MRRVWDCIFGIPRAVAPVESICCFCFLLLGEIFQLLLPGLKNYFIYFFDIPFMFSCFSFLFFFIFSPGRFDRDQKIDQYSNVFLLKNQD